MGKVLVQDLAKMLTPNTEMKLYDHVHSDDPFIIASAEAILNEWIFNGVRGMRVRKHYGAGWACVEVDVDRDTVKDIKAVPIDDSFEQILISAERYACGRSTYIVEMTVEYITALLPRLEDSTLFIIRKDIYEAERDRYGLGLGMEFDARAWHSLEQAIEEEQRKREEAGEHNEE